VSLKIWIVNHYADPPDGLATRSFDLGRAAVRRGHTVTIFSSNFSHYRHRQLRRVPGLRLWRVEWIEGVRFVWVRTPPYRANDIRRIVNMVVFAAVALLAGTFLNPRPDAVVGVSVHPLAALAGWAIAGVRRASFVFEVTDLWPQTLIEFGRIADDGVTARAMRRLERFLFRRASRIVMLWRDTVPYVQRAAGVGERVVWIPHLADPRRYDAILPYDGGRKVPFTLMFLGGFVESNCVERMLMTAAELQRRGRKDIVFELIGEGTQKEAMIDRARSMGLSNVTFPPAVPKSDVPRVMSRADAFIYGLRDLPLYRYGISLNKLADYLASARPIVFFGRSSYDAVAQAGAGFSVPSGEPAAIADAVEELVARTPQERQAMGELGKQHLRAYHDIDMLTERFLLLFQERTRNAPTPRTV
jgi:glycosyltransferase involved in cell wall biosynthesis